MVREVGEQVVVLTGASSGIGRDTALELARRGAKLVLAARNREALDTLVGEVERLGGLAVAVATDVSDYQQLTELASRAVERFGRIDTWVNNASVSTYGTVEQLDVEEIRRVIEVNLLGEIYGMKAALPHLRRSGGTIINVSSTLGKRAVALQAAYCAAKHGVVAFGEALRLELRHAKVPVAVVDVLPSSINTPLFEHARSKLGVMPQPIPPIYEPRVVADRPDDGRDNLYQPIPGPGRTTGQFGRRSKSTSLYTRWFGLHPARARLAGGVTLAAGLAALRWAGRRR
jgi:NAD(P)-dependent dehydrogenase (short-subunit alcohol dehydrogenase family)